MENDTIIVIAICTTFVVSLIILALSKGYLKINGSCKVPGQKEIAITIIRENKEKDALKNKRHR
jgi:hypothetical protein